VGLDCLVESVEIVELVGSHMPSIRDGVDHGTFNVFLAQEKELANAFGRVQEIIAIDESSCRLGSNWPTGYCSISKRKANDLQVVTRVKSP